MSNIQLDLPSFVRRDVEAFAKLGGVSAEQLMIIAIAEKIAALRTAALLQNPTVREIQARYRAVLAKVPARRPLKGDEIPPALAAKLARRKLRRDTQK